MSDTVAIHDSSSHASFSKPSWASEDDCRFMQDALALGRQNLGMTAPNPSVGCVLVQNGKVVGQGITAFGGRPHAEVLALEEAKDKAKGACAYVTLEPCAHQGQTGPCCEALIKAKISRCVIAIKDPNPLTKGKGILRLREAGIQVDVGLFEQEAGDDHAGFFHTLLSRRPKVSLKIAASLDGRTALANGQSRWITNAKAREEGHRLRASHDAILIGRKTLEEDDPDLRCRLSGLENRSPRPVVIDPWLKGSLLSKLLSQGKERQTLVFHHPEVPSGRLKTRQAFGGTFIPVEADAQGLSLTRLLDCCVDQGVTRLLIEGGAYTSTSFLKAGYVDEIHWFIAPKLIGEEGRSALGALNLDSLVQSEAYCLKETKQLDDNIYFKLERNECLQG